MRKSVGIGVAAHDPRQAREIVTGRLIGKLSQLAMVIAAGVPALVFTAALAGFGPLLILVFLLLPTAVGFGGGGLAAFASVLSRRGRDALLTIYLVDVFLMLTPLASMLGLPRVAFDWVSAMNPFVGLDSLVQGGDATLVLSSAGLWTLFGVVGIALASWRLRPSCLALTDGELRCAGEVEAWLRAAHQRAAADGLEGIVR